MKWVAGPDRAKVPGSAVVIIALPSPEVVLLAALVFQMILDYKAPYNIQTGEHEPDPHYRARVKAAGRKMTRSIGC